MRLKNLQRLFINEKPHLSQECLAQNPRDKLEKSPEKDNQRMATSIFMNRSAAEAHPLAAIGYPRFDAHGVDAAAPVIAHKQTCSPRYSSPNTPHLGAFGNAQIESLRIILNHVSEAIFLMDQYGVIQMMNPYGEQLFCVDRERLLGQPLTRFFPQPFATEYAQLLKEWSEVPLSESTFSHGPREVLIERQDGSTIEVDISLSSLPADERLYIGIMHDLSAHKKENSELRRLARTDYLTQLANRRAFDEVLQRQWTDCKANDLPLSVIIIDIDHFKTFNDECGHLQGDLVLRQIAHAIASALPSNRMLAARYGGEEFAVILPGCHLNHANDIAQRIRENVNALVFSADGLCEPRTLSVSQGLACTDSKSIKSVAGLMNTADVALYRAKLNGRDRIMQEAFG